MAFLGALTALGGGLEEAEKTQIAAQKSSLDQLLKQEMLQLRSLQMGNALNKQQTATNVDAALTGIGLGGTDNPDDVGIIPPAPPTPGPGAALAPPQGTPPAGPQTAAGAPPGQPAAGQPSGQMPPQGPPQGQLAQMGNVQGQQGKFAPGMGPPGPQGVSFAQQGQVQVPQMQAQPQQGRGPAYASLQPQAPQPGLQQQQQPPQQPQGQQIAQAGQPQQRPQPQQQRQPTTPDQLMARLKAFRTKSGQPLSSTELEAAYNKGLGQMQKAQQMQRQGILTDLAINREKRAQAKEAAQEAEKKKAGQPDEARAQAIAKYDLRPLPTYGKMGESNKATMDRVLEINPDYDETKFYGKQTGARAEGGLRSKEEMSFITKDSGSVKSFNVLVPHLATLQNTVEALNKGYNNVPSSFLRQLRNYWLEKFGSELPTDFKAVKDIVGFELIKAITGGAQALGDREEIRKALDAANSPDQLLSVINRYRELSSGQLRGLKKKYESQTGKEDFDERFLSDDTKKMFLEGKTETKQQPADQQRPARKPGDLVRFKDGTVRPFKGGDDLNPDNYGEPVY